MFNRNVKVTHKNEVKSSPSKSSSVSSKVPVKGKNAQNKPEGRKTPAPKKVKGKREDAEQHRKIFITYLNDPDRERNADLISLVDAVALKSKTNRSKYITQLIVKDLLKRGVLKPSK
jgi:hypothetical protein